MGPARLSITPCEVALIFHYYSKNGLINFPLANEAWCMSRNDSKLDIYTTELSICCDVIWVIGL